MIKGLPEHWNSSRMSESQFAYLLIVPVLVVLLAISIYPIFYSLWISFNDVDLTTGTWEFVGLAKYISALKDSFVVKAIRITALYMVMVSTISMGLSIGIALLLNENFYGKRFLLTVVILPWAVSSYGTAVIWRYIYSSEIGMINSVMYRLGLVDSYVQILTSKTALLGAAIAHAWQITPLGVYFALACLQVIPEDLYRSAKVDGLGPIGRFRYVTWSYIRGTVIIFAVIAMSWAAKVFDTVWFLVAGGPGTATTTITFKIYDATFLKLDLGYGAAISTILYLVVTAITLVYFRLVLVERKRREYTEPTLRG